MLSSPVKRVFVFGIAWLIAYSVSAIIFFKERIFLDGAYYFFHTVQKESFHIEHQRFILAISQALTVLGAKIHQPLNVLLLLNSLTPVFFLWGLFLLSILWLRHEGIAWCLLLASVCGITFIYFIPMYEVWYGCTLLIFFAGMLEKRVYVSIGHQILFGLVLITLLFSYPLIFIGIIYFSMVHFLQVKQMPPGRLAVVYVLSFGLWLGWKYFFLSEYETGKIEYPLSQQGDIMKQNFGDVQNLWAALRFFFDTYLVEMVYLMATVAGLLLMKARLQAGILLMTVAGFLLLISCFHVQPWKHSNYFERMYLLLVPLCFVPFATWLLPSLSRNLFFDFCFVMVLLLEGWSIIENSDRYVSHIDQIEMVIDKAKAQPGSKFYVDFAANPELTSLDEWSLPMETLIFSSLKDPDGSVTVSWKADIMSPEIMKQLDSSTFRLRLGEIYPDAWLNEDYFTLRAGPYVELSIK